MFVPKSRFHIIALLVLGVFAARNVAASSLEPPRSLLEEGVLEDKENAGEDENHEALLRRSLGALSSLAAAGGKRRSKKQIERKVAQKFADAMLDAAVEVSLEILESDEYIDQNALSADESAQHDSAKEAVKAMDAWLASGKQVPVPVPGLGLIFAFITQILGLGVGGLGAFFTALLAFICVFPGVPC